MKLYEFYPVGTGGVRGYFVVAESESHARGLVADHIYAADANDRGERLARWQGVDYRAVVHELGKVVEVQEG